MIILLIAGGHCFTLLNVIGAYQPCRTLLSTYFTAEVNEVLLYALLIIE